MRAPPHVRANQNSHAHGSPVKNPAALAAAAAANAHSGATGNSAQPQSASATPPSEQKYSRPTKIKMRSVVSSPSAFSLVDSELMDQLATFVEKLVDLMIQGADALQLMLYAAIRHKTIEVTLLWTIMALINFWTAFPVEWLVFVYFTITIFAQAYELGVTVVIVLITLVLMTDLLVMLILPYRITAATASAVVHSFFIAGIHNFSLSLDFANVRGWAAILVMIMLRFTAWSPPTPPPAFMSPIAAHCTGFGLSYMTWKIMFFAYRRFDTLCAFFGIVSPLVPVLAVREITENSFKIHWTANPPNPEVDEEADDPGVRATVKKHLIEVNGVMVGECGADETCVAIMGLNPDSRYRVRIWAVAEKRIKCPSKSMLIWTLPKLGEASIDTSLSAKSSTQPSSIQESNGKHASSTGRGMSHSKLEQASRPRSPKPTKAELEEESKRLQETVAKLKTELEVLSAQQKEIEDASAAVMSSHAMESAQLRSELAQLRESRRSGDAARAEVRAKLRELEEEKKAIENAKSSIERDLKKTNEAIDLLRAREEAVRLEMTRVEAEIKKVAEGMKGQASAHESTVNRLTLERDERKKRIEVLRSQLLDRESEVVGLKDEASQLRIEVEELEESLSRSIEDELIQRAQARKIQLAKEHSELIDVFRGLQLKHVSLQRELAGEIRSREILIDELNRGRREAQIRLGIATLTSKPHSASSLLTSNSSERRSSILPGFGALRSHNGDPVHILSLNNATSRMSPSNPAAPSPHQSMISPISLSVGSSTGEADRYTALSDWAGMASNVTEFSYTSQNAGSVGLAGSTRRRRTLISPTPSTKQKSSDSVGTIGSSMDQVGGKHGERKTNLGLASLFSASPWSQFT